MTLIDVLWCVAWAVAIATALLLMIPRNRKPKRDVVDAVLDHYISAVNTAVGKEIFLADGTRVGVIAGGRVFENGKALLGVVSSVVIDEHGAAKLKWAPDQNQ